MTVVDYYGASICLSFIAILSEEFPYGLLWAVGFNLLGGAVCCLYMAYRCMYTTPFLADKKSRLETCSSKLNLTD